MNPGKRLVRGYGNVKDPNDVSAESLETKLRLLGEEVIALRLAIAEMQKALDKPKG